MALRVAPCGQLVVPVSIRDNVETLTTLFFLPSASSSSPHILLTSSNERHSRSRAALIREPGVCALVTAEDDSTKRETLQHSGKESQDALRFTLPTKGRRWTMTTLTRR